MNNGSKPSGIILNIETMPSFGACALKAKLPSVIRITVSGLEVKGPSRLEVSIVGKCGDTEFIKRSDFVRECFVPESYSLKNTVGSVLDFTSDSFEYDTAFLNSIEEEKNGYIYVRVRYGSEETISKCPIVLVAYNTWMGLEAEPSAICSFVCTEDKAVSMLCNDVTPVSYNSFSKKNLMEKVREIYKKLKECNLIYTRPAGYLANAKQNIRFPEELFESNSILATPLEIALLFNAVAEKYGFDTCLVFVRGSEGEIGVWCGVYLTKSPVNIPVCENAGKIRALVDAGDLLVVDPSVFAAAQNTSFTFACENTAELFVNNPASLVCLVDVKKAKLLCGQIEEQDEFENLSVKSSVAKIYSSLHSSPVMQLLCGKKRDELEEIPLLLPDFDISFGDTQAVYRLLPLEFNVNLSDFAAIDKDFSSILTFSSAMAKQHFSSNELERMKMRLNRFKEKISKPGTVTTALRDEQLYRIASEIAFGKNKKEPYFAFGYVKITDKLTELVTFAPVCLVKASFTYDNGHFYVKQDGNPVVNKVFIRNALKNSALGYDSFMKSLMPTDKKEIFDMFENIRTALEQTDDRRIYEIVKEAHIVNVDIDDYVLWSNLALTRGKISESLPCNNVFGVSKSDKGETFADYIPAKLLSENGLKAVCCESDMSVTGAFSGEKEDVFVSLAAKSVAENKSMLVVTDDAEQSQYVKELLRTGGLKNTVTILDGKTNGQALSERLSDVLENYKGEKIEKIEKTPEELNACREIFRDYTERLSKKHRLGMSLYGSARSYLYACRGQNGVDDIYVDKKIFKDADAEKLDFVFEKAGELISVAKKVCTVSGLEVHTPLNKHPLFDVRPEHALTDEHKESAKNAIAEIIPILSQYRDVFYDVNEILSIDEREIDTLEKLEKINELYMLVLSARDVDIPEKFVESDISGYTRNKRLISENMKRMEAIEFKLNFFSPEIFEDIETLLRGDEYEEEEEKGILKKFMQKNNSQDMLLQYVNADKRGEFRQHKLSDLYKLLYEYKSCLLNLKSAHREEKEAEENGMKLAYIAENAYRVIDFVSKAPENEKKKRLSNVFRLVSVIPVDSALARKMTLMRAKLSEMCSDDINGLLGILSKTLSVDFYSVRFENGILAFDGFAKYLEDIEKKLDCSDVWSLWLNKSKAAREFVPHFVEYLEKHGASGNVDRIFAKSILRPVSQCIKEDSLKGFLSEKLGKTKEEYISLLKTAGEISLNNACTAHRINCASKEVGELVNTLEGFKTSSVREILEKQSHTLLEAFPVIIVCKNSLTELLPIGLTFDNAVLFDNKDNGFTMLPGMGYGRRAVVMNMSCCSMSELCKLVSKNAHVFDVCSVTKNKDSFVYPWINSVGFGESGVCVGYGDRPSAELVRMNGTFDRTTGRVNKNEVEHSLVKATEMLADRTKSVVLSAFTKEQCTEMEKLLNILVKKNRLIQEAVNENRISVSTPDRLYMKQYDRLVVCACFGADKEGRIGWDFGYAGVTKDGVLPEAYISIGNRKCDKICVLTSLNVKDSRFIRRTGKNAELFNSFCEMLSDGRIPVSMRNNDFYETQSLVPEIMACVTPEKSRLAPCAGKVSVKYALYQTETKNNVSVLCDTDKGCSMHDLLYIRELLLQEDNLVVTLSPIALAGDECRDTLDSIAIENERISG